MEIYSILKTEKILLLVDKVNEMLQKMYGNIGDSRVSFVHLYI